MLTFFLKSEDFTIIKSKIRANEVVVEWFWKNLVFLVIQVRLPLSLLFSAASR
ncbi:hypothetical protein Hanom_Chr07g00592121 [Helianthus anomalus]